MNEDLVEVALGSDGINELRDGPCPTCGEPMLQDIKAHPMECVSEDTTQTETIFVSGLKCFNCEEVYFDDPSAELHINTMEKLDGEAEKGKKKILTEWGFETVSIH